jgi:serine/threonine protein kinase
MADSLFDNRYRYNYIYPRGRSGETLRAIDTQSDDRPVVIKRPAPNDAPPIRAGQEVSIINERDALTRLSGHPILTELLGTGQFFVGGMPHQYIVMERAEGVIIEAEVSRLAAQDQRLPELEMLQIIDRLIDLLQTAHDLDIVYNDVDAKHLFWNRDTYTLKVIDWGNAVFLEGDDVTPQGISRQTDVYQVGELLYFIMSGGRRADVPRDADDQFALNFHDNDVRVHSRLQEIISKAVHPNARMRYASLKLLRDDLSQYRAPLDRERNIILARTSEKLKTKNLSRSDLTALQTQLEPVLKQDPAHPATKEIMDELSNRLLDLAVSADLDAVHIYMENNNWSRAADLLKQLRDRSGTQTEGIVRLLLDWCILLMDIQVDHVPSSILDAIALVFEAKPDKAAHILLVKSPDDDRMRLTQWRMAERITSHFPDVLLLRPNLYRLDNAVRQLAADGIPVTEARTILQVINSALDATARMDSPSASHLRDVYREVVDSISSLYSILQTLSLQHEFSERRLPLNALTRALNASMALADHMHIIGKQAAANPRDALSSLDSCREIDPANPVWNQIEDFLNHLYKILQSSQTYVPSADGTDLAEWLSTRQAELLPFSEKLFDDMLSGMLDGVRIADNSWKRYRDVIITGDKTAAIKLLHSASQAVTMISPTLSAWFNQLRSVIDGAQYVERHSVPGLLGRTIADGWESFDRGQLANAERLGQQAIEISRNENERNTSERLWRLSRILREWTERNGVYSESRTQNTLADIENLFTDDEQTTVEAFGAQMPSNDTYLKAMGQGIVKVFESTSSAALRILFAQYVLLGVLDTHEGRFADAEFWRTASTRVLPTADRHISIQTLDDFVAQRESLQDIQATFATINGKHALRTMEDTRRSLENNPQARLIAAAIQSTRTLDAAIQDWSDAEFRSAGMKLEEVLKRISECESTANITLTNYRAWVMELQSAVAELVVLRRAMLQQIDRRPDDPLDSIRDALKTQARVTVDLIGEEQAGVLVSWYETYEHFLDTYTSDLRRSHKLKEFDELFKALFIDRHPAYPLYRHWYSLVDNSSEFPAPDPDAPPPEVVDTALEVTDPTLDLEIELDEPDESIPPTINWVDPEQKPNNRLNMWIIGVGLLGAIALIATVMALNGGGTDDGRIIAGVDLTITDTPSDADVPTVTMIPNADMTEVEQTPQDIVIVADVPSSTPEPFDTPTPPASATSVITQTDAPTATHTFTPTATTTSTPTVTHTPTETYTPTITYTPSIVPTETYTPTVTLPPQGIQGSVNLLDQYTGAQDDPFWNTNQFIMQDGAWRLGVGTATEGETIFFFPPENLLNDVYGNNASSRITRIEAELALRTFNPSVVDSEDVYFGIMFQSTADSNNAGIQLQAVQSNVINLAQYVDNTANFVSQRSVNAVIARLRLDRDTETGNVVAYFNDSQIGNPIEFLPPDAPIVPVIFVKDGGVIVGVTAWRITLQ